MMTGMIGSWEVVGSSQEEAFVGAGNLIYVSAANRKRLEGDGKGWQNPIGNGYSLPSWADDSDVQVDILSFAPALRIRALT